MWPGYECGRIDSACGRKRRAEPISEAVAQAAKAGAEGVEEREGRRRGRPSDAFGGTSAAATSSRCSSSIW